MADNRFEVVPPDTRMPEMVAAFESIAVVMALCWAVKVPAFRPKEIPFELLRIIEPEFWLAAPALMF
jgi:hypothetical protein